VVVHAVNLQTTGVMRAWLPFVLLAPLCAQAQVWGYVDGAGVAHVAPTQVDSRYHLVLGNAAGGDTTRVPGKTDGAGGLLTWLEFAPEVKSLQAILREAAKAHAVDIELLKAIIAVESGFDAKAVSPKGAVGLMQIMPAGEAVKHVPQKRSACSTRAPTSSPVRACSRS
jgi:Transglycosylase SLT domain